MGKIINFNHKLQRFLIQNNVTGCTMAWNKALMKIIQSDFTKSNLHDWFIVCITNFWVKLFYTTSSHSLSTT